MPYVREENLHSSVIKIGESFKTAGKVETCGSDFVPEDIRRQNRDFVTNTLQVLGDS
jgi:hypothetical protein